MGNNSSTFIYTESGIFIRSYMYGEEIGDGLDTRKHYVVKRRAPTARSYIEDVGVTLYKDHKWVVYSCRFAIGTLTQTRTRLRITKRFLRIQDAIDSIQTLGAVQATFFVMEQDGYSPRSYWWSPVTYSRYRWKTVSKVMYDMNDKKWIVIPSPDRRFERIYYDIICYCSLE